MQPDASGAQPLSCVFLIYILSYLKSLHVQATRAMQQQSNPPARLAAQTNRKSKPFKAALLSTHKATCLHVGNGREGQTREL